MVTAARVALWGICFPGTSEGNGIAVFAADGAGSCIGSDRAAAPVKTRYGSGSTPQGF